MINFKHFLEASSDPCWKGYEMVGMKEKGKKKVPNCVPVSEEIAPLKTHAKWDQNRYERLKLNGHDHAKIKVIWDDEVQAEKEAEKMKNAANKVKK